MATSHQSTNVTPLRDRSEMRDAKTRVAWLEQQISQADFYITKALECRSEGYVRRAIVRIAHETLKDTMKRP